MHSHFQRLSTILTRKQFVLKTSIFIVTIATSKGLGEHVQAIPEDNLPAIGLLGNFIGTLSILASVWSKTSFALTLLRLLSGRWTKDLLWLGVATIHLFLIVNALFMWIRCSPAAKTWDVYMEGTCWDNQVYPQYAMFAAGMFCYILVDRLALVLIWFCRILGSRRLHSSPSPISTIPSTPNDATERKTRRLSSHLRRPCVCTPLSPPLHNHRELFVLTNVTNLQLRNHRHNENNRNLRPHLFRLYLYVSCLTPSFFHHPFPLTRFLSHLLTPSDKVTTAPLTYYATAESALTIIAACILSLATFSQITRPENSVASDNKSLENQSQTSESIPLGAASASATASGGQSAPSSSSGQGQENNSGVGRAVVVEEGGGGGGKGEREQPGGQEERERERRNRCWYKLSPDTNAWPGVLM